MRPNPSVMVVESSLSLLVKSSIEQQQNDVIQRFGVRLKLYNNK